MKPELLGTSMKQIYAFLIAAEKKNITLTANELFTSQTSVSRCIASLEEDLGVKLFNRYSNGVELTEAGNSLYKQWKLLIDGMDAAAENVIEEFAQKKYTISIADFCNIPVSEFVFPIINGFTKQNSGISIELNRLEISETIAGILNKKYDAAFVSEPGVYALKEAGYCVKEIAVLNANIIIGNNNPAVKDGKIDKDKLSSQTLLLLERSDISKFDRVLKKMVMGILKHNGITAGKIETSSNANALCAKLAMGDYYTVLSLLDKADLNYIPVDGEFRYYIGYRENDSLEMKKFIDYLEQY